MPVVPWLLMVAATQLCAPVDGWNDGRRGEPVKCARTPYVEAHKLGAALRELTVERDALAAGMKSLGTAEQGVALRRQRQLQNDIEALQGVATVRGWPYEGKPAPEKLQ